MPATTNGFAAREKALLRDHNYHIVDWVAKRVMEEYDPVTKKYKLYAEELKATAEGYVEWSALVVEAVIANLEKRRWTETKSAVTAMANKSLEEAKKRPTDGAKGMPALL